MEHIDFSPSGYFLFGDDGIIRAVNKSFCDLLQWRKDEITGKSVENILTVSSRIFYQTHLFPLLRMHGHAEEIYITLAKRDSLQLPVLLNVQKVEEHGYACSFITVFNRKKFEDELLAARRTAEKALHENTALQQVREELQQYAEQLDDQLSMSGQQNEELRQFNRIVTHELQEPLRKILLFSKQVEKENRDNPEQQKSLDRLARGVEQLRLIVSGLQKFVWLQESGFNFELIDLNNVIRQAEQLLVAAFPNQPYELHVETFPSMEGDEEKLAMFFFHVFSNSLKFAREGEHACISITSTLIDRNSFRSVRDKYKYEQYIKLDISDCGIGFDPHYGDQAMELFKRLHVNEGRGVGLALCKKIIDNHSGFLSIDSDPGKGTTVTALLPLSRNAGRRNHEHT